MIEKIFSILAAVVVIIIAGFLVRLQNKQKEKLEKLSDEILNSLDEAVTEFIALTGQSPTENSTLSLEQSIRILNNCLRSNKTKNHKKERSHHVKSFKKNATND